MDGRQASRSNGTASRLWKITLSFITWPVFRYWAFSLSGWLGVCVFPAILLLLGFGMILGLFVRPDQMLAELTGSDPSVGPKILFPIVSLAVAAILFEGGLTLKFSELKSAGNIVLRLVSIGALVTWVLTSLAAWLLLRMDGHLAILLGAILVVTGPTVVIPLLRHIRPSRRIGSIVKWEGIVIDPVGAVLAVLVFEQLFMHAGDVSRPVRRCCTWLGRSASVCWGASPWPCCWPRPCGGTGFRISCMVRCS